MVIKGGSRSGGGNLAAHLLRTDTNERAEVVDLKGVVADRLPEALAEMEAVASGTRCRKSLYHASINTGPGEELTLEQKAHAVAALELKLGLEGHARAVVEHRKEGRDHLHVVWSRIDVDTMKATHDGHNYRRHEEVARELEREFGHNRVQGAHHERDRPEGRQPRPPRTPPTPEMQQAARTKTDPATITAEITRLWRAADSGPAFAIALAEAGYVLAQGDRRGFCIVDQAGGTHSLARRIEGVKTKEVNDRLAGIELNRLPTAAQARDQARARQGTENTPQDPVRDLVPVPTRGPQADHRAPETGRGKTEVSRSMDVPPLVPEATHAPADRRDGPNFQQQLADSREYQAKPSPSRSSNRADPGRDLDQAARHIRGGAAKAAGAVLDAATGLLGFLLGNRAKERTPEQTGPRPKPETKAVPQREARPSAAEELAAKARERREQLGPRPAAPEPDREKDKGREREPNRSTFVAPVRTPNLLLFEIMLAKARQELAGRGGKPSQPRKVRPSLRPFHRLLEPVLAGISDVTWAVKARQKLIEHSNRTGENVVGELMELQEIIARAYLGSTPRKLA